MQYRTRERRKSTPFVWLMLVTGIVFQCPAVSQQPHPIAPKLDVEVTGWSAKKLLSKSNSLRKSDGQQSLLYADLALKKAKSANDRPMTAQAHLLLGKLTKQLKDYSSAKQHFIQVADIERGIGNEKKQVFALIEYARTLYEAKEVHEGLRVTGEIIAIAQHVNEPTLISRAFSTRANGYYKIKDFAKSLEANQQALSYLTGNTSKEKQALASIYHQIGQVYKHLNQPQNALAAYSQVYELSEAIGAFERAARALKNIAKIEYQLHNYLAAIDYALRSLSRYEQLSVPFDHAETAQLLGMSYRNIGLYEKSLTYTQDAHETYRRLNSTDKIADTSNQIGLLYTRLGKHKESRSFYQLSVDLKDRNIKPTTLAAAYRELAALDYLNGSYAPAMELAKLSIAIYLSNNDLLRASHSVKIVGHIYRAQNNQTAALESYQTSLDYARQSNSTEHLIKSLNALGEFLIDKDEAQAAALLEESIVLAQQQQLEQHALYAFRALRTMYLAKGNTEKSLYFAVKEIEAINKFNEQQDAFEINQVKAKLDSYKLESELKSLRKRVQIDELNLAKQNSELELVKQAHVIAELELSKNKYANIALVAVLFSFSIIALFAFRTLRSYRARNIELNDLAIRDPLTNCFNRRALFKRLDDDFKSPSNPFLYAIVVADIDRFKAINDSYGHNAGDKVIKGVADILQSAVRQNDLISRLGGEEFCILLPGANIERAKLIAETMRETIEATSFNNIGVTCSFGIAVTNSATTSTSALMNSADKALYESKKQGRNCVSAWQAQD